MIKQIRIFAADIDGTLLTKGGELMPKTRAAMQRLHNEGVLMGVASGRPLDKTILDKAKEWDLGFDFDFAIGMNGGDLWMKETGIFEHFYQLQSEDIKAILEMVWDLDLNAIVYKDAYAEIRAKRLDDFLKDSKKRNHSHVEIGDIEFLSEYPSGKIELQMKQSVAPELFKRAKEHPREHVTWVKTFDLYDHTTIEFMDDRVHKGLALEEYAKRKGISLDEVIAFGDMENDIGLLKSAGWGVCLQNGSEDTKAISDAITEYDVLHDGVGRYLEDHIFSSK